MEFVIGGYLNKQIAAELGIAEKTVKVHRGRIMTKMAVRSAAELIHHCAFAGVEPRLRR
jgi:FixJ family two-component response regulator